MLFGVNHTWHIHEQYIYIHKTWSPLKTFKQVKDWKPFPEALLVKGLFLQFWLVLIGILAAPEMTQTINITQAFEVNMSENAAHLLRTWMYCIEWEDCVNVYNENALRSQS